MEAAGRWWDSRRAAPCSWPCSPGSTECAASLLSGGVKNPQTPSRFASLLPKRDLIRRAIFPHPICSLEAALVESPRWHLHLPHPRGAASPAWHRRHGIGGLCPVPPQAPSPLGVSVHHPPAPAAPGPCTDLAVAPGTSAPRAPVPPPQPSP